MNHIVRSLLLAALANIALSACQKQQSTVPIIDNKYGAMKREEFNRRAAELFLPLFWREDANKDAALQPEELAVLWGYGDDDASHWIDAQHKFTAQFDAAYQRMKSSDPAAANDAEKQRHDAVIEELAQGRPTLVQTDLSKDNSATVNMVRHLLNAAKAIERIYAQQKGVLTLQAQILAGDAASQMLFYRNQSPFCEAPKTENNPACSALPTKPAHIVGLYPADIQSSDQFCNALTSAPNAKQLMDHFSVVTAGDKPNSFKSVPYNEAYKPDMELVANELDAAASGLGEDEAAFKTYLTAAAQSFRSNDWEPANRAWVAMSPDNSKWYARIAPDEVYYEPCAWKAGFALQLARINPDSLAWKQKLDPLKAEMENNLAAMAGKPYQARNVQFKLPDFIDVVLNAGDQRNAHGATIGQSLPNWGPVAASGGRTVAMTNLYSDADSQASAATLMASLFCSATNEHATTSGKETLISSLLHEAAHNLGPAHEYKANGKVDTVAFSGTLASTLEELKAQTSSMYLTNWLSTKGIFSNEEVNQIQLRNVAWGFGHISRGMYAADGTPRNYSQLAAIQLGSLLQGGAVSWLPDQKAANGEDQGCIEIHFEKVAGAVQALETKVLQIKAKGDKAQAEQLKAMFVDDKDDDFAKLKNTIAERWLRAPKATFVYSLQF